MKNWWVCFLALACGAQAELRLPHLFADGMVLQRDQEVPVWGWADPGVQVTVEFGGKQFNALADDEGSFLINLDQMDASSEPRIMKVSAGKDAVEISQVLVGEVWLCAGHSNMQWPVKKSMNFNEERAAANYPEIRMFLTFSKTATEPQDDAMGFWKTCSPETVGDFSATGYFFGREIHQELGVPVGLIRSGWGGTRIEAWSPMKSLEKFSEVMAYKKQRDELGAMYDAQEAEEQFAKAEAEWKKDAEEARNNGQNPPKRPMKETDPLKDQHYPANLYNAMIHPLVPYAMQGAIWYQGEANAHSLEQSVFYEDLLSNMVEAWRNEWNNEFPFYAVQLVNFKMPAKTPVQDGAWTFIRESFLSFSKSVPNTGIAVGIDAGEANDIHPKNKQVIGKRLAQQALAKTYGKQVVADGPVYRSMERKGDEIILHFDQVGAGLEAKDGPLTWFAVAGNDRTFVTAEAEIRGDAVVVKSAAVSDPVAVRYAWADNPDGCNLYNKDGLPASPFRTDDWPPVGK